MNTTMENNSFFEGNYPYLDDLHGLYLQDYCPFDEKFYNLDEIMAKHLFYILRDNAIQTFFEDMNLGDWTKIDTHIFKDEKTGTKVKIGFKLWGTIDKNKSPFFSIFQNDNTDDYDYKIQFLALSKNSEYKNIRKIFVLGFLSKDEIIKIYKSFTPNKTRKYPSFTIDDLSDISKLVNKNTKNNKFKKTYDINKSEIETITRNIQKEIKIIDDSIYNTNPEPISKTINSNYIKQARDFSKSYSEKMYDDTTMDRSPFESKENTYLNTIQGKIAEMAVYDFLKDKDLVNEEDWNRMLRVWMINYDFGDFILPNNKVIDVKSYCSFDDNNPCFNLSSHNLEKNIDYFVFAVIEGIQTTKYNEKSFDENEYKVNLYGFISKNKIKSLINENKIKKNYPKYKYINVFYSTPFYSIPWKYIRPMNEIYKP